MMTKEEDFKNRFATLMRDLQQDGTKNPQAVRAIGVLALALAKQLKSTTWSGAKSNITMPIYDQLLKQLEHSGNEHYQAGRHNEAYAIQALSYSLVARTQAGDPQMAQGEALLDAAIDRAVLACQRAAPTKAH